MATTPALPVEARTASPTVSADARWLLPALTSLLAGIAVLQLVYFVPRSVWIAQRLAGEQPGYINLLMAVPGWLALAAAAALVVTAVWQRGSVQRSALLMAVAVAVNVALLICILGCLSKVIGRAEPGPASDRAGHIGFSGFVAHSGRPGS